MKTTLSLGSVAAFALTVVACSGGKADANANVAQTANATGCNVKGVWSLDSVTVDGKAESREGQKQMKIISGTHYSWVNQQGGAMPLVTTADSLAAYRTRGSGGGTYRVTDSTYVEHLEFFYDPREIGKDVTITCRVVGNRWDHSFDWPGIENGKSVTRHVQEIWRRVE